jgi:uncharacterized membrane protein YgcG
MTTKFRSTLYLLIAMLVLVTTTQVLAQSGNAKPTNEKEFTGVVTAITPTTVTISTMTFDIVQAEVSATIRVGDTVKVHYTVATNGTFVAREIQFAVDVTPEATDIFDDHGQDDPAMHDVGDDHGQDNLAGQVEDNHNQQNDDNNRNSGDNGNRGSGNSGSQGGNSGRSDDGGSHGGKGQG